MSQVVGRILTVSIRRFASGRLIDQLELLLQDGIIVMNASIKGV